MLTNLGYAYARSGEENKAWELLEQARERGADPGSIAILYAALGEHDRAIEWLERAFDKEAWETVLFNIKVFPMLDPLRSDPRFQDLLRRMNFPE